MSPSLDGHPFIDRIYELLELVEKEERQLRDLARGAYSR